MSEAHEQMDEQPYKRFKHSAEEARAELSY
jgi:hypothetical protein